MSVVTNVILSYIPIRGLSEEETLKRINAYFQTTDRPTNFNHIERDSVGGTMCLECDLAIGAFNHLDLEELIAHIRTLKFMDTEAVQLMVMGQNDYKFSIIDVFGETGRALLPEMGKD